MIPKSELKKHFDLGPPQKSNRPTDEKKLLLWWADNCEKLAQLMREVDDGLTESKHAQSEWGTVRHCGTSACALGHAALYNIIPGLQWTLDQPYWYPLERIIRSYMNRENVSIAPLRDGEKSTWDSVGEFFFGEHVHWTVFTNADLSSAKVIKALRDHAKKYRQQAGKLA